MRITLKCISNETDNMFDVGQVYEGKVSEQGNYWVVDRTGYDRLVLPGDLTFLTGHRPHHLVGSTALVARFEVVKTTTRA